MKVDGAIENSSFTSGWVAGNVVAVWGVRDVFQTCEVVRVVQGGGELTDATADCGVGTTIQNDAGINKALGCATWAGVVVEGERIAR